MDIAHILSQMLVLALIMAVGYLLNKIKLIDQKGSQVLTKVVLNVAVPSSIINSILGKDATITGKDMVFTLVLGLIAYVIYWVIAIVIPKLMRTKKEDSGIYKYMLMYPNSGFVGYPVTEAIFGAQSLAYASIYNIPFYPLAFSVGVSFIKGGKAKFSWKHIVNPAFISTVIALVLRFCGVGLPGFIMNTASTFANLLTPLAMLATGILLASVPIKEVFTDWHLYPMTIIRTIGIPVIVWLIMKNFVHDSMMLGVLVVLSGMPAAASTTMLSIEHGGNDKLAAKCVFMTTVASVFTIPLLVAILPF